MQNITKKQIYFVGFLLVLFVVFYVAYLLYSNRTITLYAAPVRLPQPLNVSIENSNSIIFSNGRYFVRYQLSSNKTTPLGDDLNLPLPVVSDVSVSHNSRYILFKSIGQDKNDILGKTLSEDNNTNTFGETDWWWVYDTETKHYQSIDARDKKNWIEMGGDELMTDSPPRNILARLSPNDSVFVLFDHSDKSKRLAEIDITSGKVKRTIKVDEGVEQFYIFEDSFIFLIKGNIVVTDTSGKVKRTINGPFSNIRNDGSSKASKVLAYRSDRKISDTSFLVIDVSTGKKLSYKGSTPESSQILSTGGEYVGYSKDEKLIFIKDDLISKKYSVEVPGDIVDVESLDFVSMVSPKILITIDRDTGLYYLLTKDKVQFQDINNTIFSINETCPRCTLEYFPEDAYFIASIPGEYSVQKKDIIYNALKNNKINKDRVNIKFSFFLYPKGDNLAL